MNGRTIFRRFRSPEAAQSAVGSSVDYGGKRYVCTGFNDLGCLYWRAAGTKRDVYCAGIDAAAGYPEGN